MSDLASDAQSADAAMLALLGKKQVLKRRFNLLSLIGFAVCELITWETVLSLFSQAFNNGGPAGAVYGFIIAWTSTFSVYTVVAELASLAPIAGGQYYWVYMMAGPRWRTLLSYIVAWLTCLAWIATVATETLLCGTIIQGILILDYPSYASKMWHGTLLTWVVLLGCVFFNVVIPSWLPRFEIGVMVLHLMGFAAILVTILVTTPELGSNASVWLTSLNEGGWSTQGLSYCVGFLGNVATFVGADASVHLCEEVANAAVNIPRAILSAMCINGAVGFAMMVALLYSLGDVESVLNPKTGFPFIEVFANSTRNIAGASFMAALVMFLNWACANGITTTASRMTWSFARDRGLPFSAYLSKVSPRTKVPVVAVLVVTFCAMLLSLIYIGSSAAFNDVISLTITGFYGSYLTPAALLLYHRIKGNVLPAGTELDSPASPASPGHGGEKDKPEYEATEARDSVEVAQARLVWGPFHLPKWLGIINNAYACLYMIFVIFWSFWPPETPVSASTMNYSVVVTGGVMILSALWYLLGGRKLYKGPLIDDEVAAVMRIGSVVHVDG